MEAAFVALVVNPATVLSITANTRSRWEKNTHCTAEDESGPLGQDWRQGKEEDDERGAQQSMAGRADLDA